MLRVVGKLAIAQVAFLLGEAFVFILHVIRRQTIVHVTFLFGATIWVAALPVLGFAHSVGAKLRLIFSRFYVLSPANKSIGRVH